MCRWYYGQEGLPPWALVNTVYVCDHSLIGHQHESDNSHSDRSLKISELWDSFLTEAITYKPRNSPAQIFWKADIEILFFLALLLMLVVDGW